MIELYNEKGEKVIENAQERETEVGEQMSA